MASRRTTFFLATLIAFQSKVFASAVKYNPPLIEIGMVQLYGHNGEDHALAIWQKNSFPDNIPVQKIGEIWGINLRQIVSVFEEFFSMTTELSDDYLNKLVYVPKKELLSFGLAYNQALSFTSGLLEDFLEKFAFKKFLSFESGIFYDLTDPVLFFSRPDKKIFIARLSQFEWSNYGGIVFRKDEE